MSAHRITWFNQPPDRPIEGGTIHTQPTGDPTMSSPTRDYTVDRLAVDLAIKVSALVDRVERLERVHAAVLAVHANPGGARAELELVEALKAAEVTR